MSKTPVGIGIWIDHENIGKTWSIFCQVNPDYDAGDYARPIIEYAATLGEIELKRAFVSEDNADFAHEQLDRYNIEIIPCEARNYRNSNNGQFTRKTLVDPRMAEQILSSAFENEGLSTYIIVTGDKDFLPTIEKLITKGKKVIVISDDDPENNQIARCIIDALQTEEARTLECKFVNIRTLL